MNKCYAKTFMVLGFLVGPLFAEMTSEEMAFTAGNLKGWKTDAEGVWRLKEISQKTGESNEKNNNSGINGGGDAVGLLPPFNIQNLSGWCFSEKGTMQDK